MTESMLDDEEQDIRTGSIKIHGAEDFEGMRKAGRLAAECLDMIAGEVKPGVTTGHLDNLIRDFVMDHGALSATIGYRGYRHASCISLNHVICHGIPGDKLLKNGDIMNIDVTVIVDGWHGDTSRMFYAGEPKVKARRLVDTTYDAMMAGIEAVKPGATLRDIGRAIQMIAEGQGFSVVRDFCGHGLGRVFHDAPNVVHYAEYKDRWGGVHQAPETELKPGMFFTIEPMINEGKPDVKLLKDNWTAVSRDKSLSAQFEHSIAVTETSFEIFTKSPKGLDKPPY
ncbi:type I methionyl aminopeptidase [Hyphococcus luteus]|uniref:Methionine aminopeptidase n=1 Tax=Hyphococcus luteus TaxID=2058213 RepID=A0A2S7JZB9_9PROT|nr:type I methionyl aminopeptidase [Marinicaulis flavus]PQA85582.1 type I methionyl aminopeptidase [Marinicaulis flavus]